MQDPDQKCRHFGISWHFMAFYDILWHFFISDSTALVRTLMIRSAVLTTNLRLVEVAKGLLLLNVTRQF